MLVWASFVILFSGTAISEQLHTVFLPFCSSFSAFSLFSSCFGKFCSDHSSHTPTTTPFQYASMGKAPAIHGSLFSTIHMQYESHVSQFMTVSGCWTSILCVPSSFCLLLFLIVSQKFYFASQGLHFADLLDLLAFFCTNCLIFG